MTPKEQALFCIDRNIHVVAGYPPGKSERAIIKGTASGTLDHGLIEQWFNSIPNRNIMINLKNSGLICIDLDQHQNGQNGVKAFDRIWSDHAEAEALNTYVEKTPTGAGVHIFFKAPIETFDKPIVNELVDGVEIKTHFVPIYPSRRTDGDYMPFTDKVSNQMLTLDDVRDCPEWLLNLLNQAPTSRASYPSSFSRSGGVSRTYGAEIWELFNQGANEGNRNIDTNKVLHYWRKIGIEPNTCMDLLQIFNNRTSPPLDDSELSTIWKSVFKMN